MTIGLKQLFHRHYRILAIAGVVILVQVVELLLLERKYDIFTGGFLQPYSYTSFTDRFLFLAASTWMDLFMFGSLGLVWFRLLDRSALRPLLSAYNFVFVSVSIMVLWLALKFKVLSYFNDTLNFLIIRNLGGGSLLEALRYVAQESTIIIIVMVLMMAAYFILRQPFARVESLTDPGVRHQPGTRVWLYLLVGLLLTTMLISLVNADPKLRYGLRKKTSFTLVSYALDAVSDWDRDGYGLFHYPTDAAFLDARIYPGALDVPDNGIDEDGYGGDFIMAGDMQDPLQGMMPKKKQHILLFILESTRWDLVDKHLNGQPVTPNIMSMLSDGTAIPYAYSHTGYTSTSLKATLNRTLSRSSNRLRTVDFLRQSGYELSFLSGQDESFGDIASSVGMDEEGVYLFDARNALEDRVYASMESASLKLSEARIVKQFQERTSELDWKRPQFIYVNLQSAHFPYTYPDMPALVNDVPIPRSEINFENRTWLEATYWNAIANADKAIGEMLGVLRKYGVYEDTLVVIMGDHGESLFDNNFLGHGHALDESQTHIPLIINRPGIDVGQAVGQVDIAQLFIELATGHFNPNEWVDREKGVFQLVGNMVRPQLIGTVRYGEVRTVLDLRMRNVFFSDLGKWVDFDEALQEPGLESRTREVLQLWEELRWQDYRAKHGLQ